MMSQSCRSSQSNYKHNKRSHHKKTFHSVTETTKKRKIRVVLVIAWPYNQQVFPSITISNRVSKSDQFLASVLKPRVSLKTFFLTIQMKRMQIISRKKDRALAVIKFSRSMSLVNFTMMTIIQPSNSLPIPLVTSI